MSAAALPLGQPGQDSTYLKYGLKAAQDQTVSPRCWHTGNAAPTLASPGTDSTPSATELYVAEIFIPANAVLTGIAIYNGSAVTDDVKVGLYTAAGVLVATNATGGAGTLTAGINGYQRIPFTSTYAVKGPGTYYIGVIFDGTVSRLRTHAAGNFGGGKIASVYATAMETTSVTGLTMPTTFTAADKPPIASVY